VGSLTKPTFGDIWGDLDWVPDCSHQPLPTAGHQAYVHSGLSPLVGALNKSFNKRMKLAPLKESQQKSVPNWLASVFFSNKPG